MLTAYQAAELAILKGQSYAIGDRQLKRADLNQVVEQRKYWQRQVDVLSSTPKRRVRRVIPRDL
ncbi:hypothetical protein KQI63_15775 [bacterium]|nr:hypothetical protein [bacterium]